MRPPPGGWQRRLRAEPRGGERPRSARPAERLHALPAFEQRHDEARGERIARSGAVDRLHGRRRRARDLHPVLEQHRALGAERDRDEAVPACERFELVPVHDREICVRHRPVGSRCGIEEEPGRRSSCDVLDGLERDLELAESGRAFGQVDVGGAKLGIRTRSDDDRVLSRGVDDDECDAGRRFALLPTRADACVAQATERAHGERVVPDAPDHRHLGAEARGGDGLVRALSTRDLRERRAGDRLAGSREPLRAGDEIEVDRTDDGEADRHVRETIPS